MKPPVLVKHAQGAPGLRLYGMGPNLIPKNGVQKLKLLFDLNTLWAKDRSIKSIKKMLSNSDLVVSAWLNNSIVGFGRATTDYTYRTTLWDIVVDKKYQTLGLGKKIVNLIINDSKILQCEKIYLMTTHSEKFYTSIGFQIENSQELMLLKKSDFETN